MIDTDSAIKTKRIRWWPTLTRQRLLLWGIVFGLLCAWLGKPFGGAIHQRYNVAKIRSLGGEVGFDDVYDNDLEVGFRGLGQRVVWLFFGEDGCAPVNTILLTSDRPFSDDDFAVITEFPEVEWLCLQGPHITDGIIPHVIELSGVGSLALVSTSLTPDGVAQLSDAELECLIVSGQVVTDDMLKSIGTLQNIPQVGFQKTKLSSAGFEQLAEVSHLRQLAVLDSLMTEGELNLSSVENHRLETLALLSVVITVDGSLHRLDFMDDTFTTTPIDPSMERHYRLDFETAQLPGHSG